jgi:hypothetical protein
MIVKSPILPNRVRKVPKSFSWIDHRLVSDRHIERCSHTAATLYLFLDIADHFSDTIYLYVTRLLFVDLYIHTKRVIILPADICGIAAVRCLHVCEKHGDVHELPVKGDRIKSMQYHICSSVDLKSKTV